jgi:hypothetical protein
MKLKNSQQKFILNVNRILKNTFPVVKHSILKISLEVVDFVW